MSVEDLLATFGLFIAPLVAITVFTAVVAAGRSRRAIAAASALSTIVVLSLAVYWTTWGASFDEVDAGREVSAGTELATAVAIGTSALATTLLAVLGAGLLVIGRSSRAKTTEHI